MCFSAEASFTASAILFPAGVYCTHIALRRRLSYLPLAVIPFFFSIQQFAEGFVWLGLSREDPALVTTASLVFLAFALGIWPFWIPLSVLFVEERKRVRWALGVGVAFGLTLGSVLYVPMALNVNDWLRPGVVHHSLRYNPYGLPAFQLLPSDFWDAAYGVCVLVPFFLLSDHNRFLVFRILLTASAVITFLVFREAFVSVWCFFAALLSSQLCYIFSRLDHPSGEVQLSAVI